MSVFHPRHITCACGASLTVDLADSVNASRSPGLRRRIIDGSLHRCTCSSCGCSFTVERPFCYIDLPRGSLFRVAPRGERHTWRAASEQLDKASNIIPPAVAGAEDRVLRTVFGMDELREKLVAQDAGLDDRIVELLKVLLVYEHPFLLKKPRLRLTLDKAADKDLEFIAAFEHGPQRFRVRLPRALADRFATEPGLAQNWVRTAHADSVFDLPDHWVNMWRWSPQPSALEALEAYAAQLKAHRPVDVHSAAFGRMLDGLPHGMHLPAWAKKALRVVFEHVKQTGNQQLQDRLFEIRFGIELADDWTSNEDLDDVDTLWSLLKDLPDVQVEGNTRINELQLDIGRGGGLYDPSTYDISIGSDELAHREGFEDVVRHEIGHAVHEMFDAKVTAWLGSEFGWKTLGRTDADIDAWIADMGGWGPLTATQKKQVRQALRAALGEGSSWSPGVPTALAPDHPWHRANFGPRLAFEQSGGHWYKNYQSWHRAGDKAFFMNFWYRTLISVDARTLDLIGRMPSDYAAMSHYEFFAELYALYYDLDDPLRAAIPPSAMRWMEANLGQAAAHMPRPAPPPSKQDWETVTRP